MFAVSGNRFSKSPFTIIIASMVLTSIGLISLLSISVHQSSDILRSSFFKQLVFLGPSLIGLLIMIFIPKYLIHKYIFTMYFIVLGVLFLPYFSRTIAGTYRWVDLGPVGFQPSEFAKLIIVFSLAKYLSDHNLEMKNFSSFFFPIIMVIIPAVIILKQPDLGTALVLLTPLLPMLYWAGARSYHIFLFLAPLLSVLTAFHALSFSIWGVLMIVIIFLERPKLIFGLVIYFSNLFLGLLAPALWNSLKDYQQNRILALINPELDPLGAAYQIIQSQTAIGSGGVFGKGWGAGTQTHLKFLPVQESDFILSVIGEELGFVFILVIILVFTWMILKMVKLGYSSKDRFSGLVLIGIASLFMAHVFVNIAMTVGMIPVKGLPLPFISSGGSFLMSCFMMVGIVMNVGVDSTE